MISHTGTLGKEYAIEMKDFVLVIEMDEHGSTDYALKISFEGEESILITQSNVRATWCPEPINAETPDSATNPQFWMIIRTVDTTLKMTALKIYKENELIFRESSEHGNCAWKMLGDKIIKKAEVQEPHAGLIKVLYVTPYLSLDNIGSCVCSSITPSR